MSLNQGPEKRLGENYSRYDNFNVSEYNNGRFNNKDYEQSMSQDFNKQLSLTQEPNITYIENIEYFTVSSRDRDVIAYPKSSSFTVDLRKEYKNIRSVELIQCIIPDKNNVQSEPYLLLKIDQLQGAIESIDGNISDSFAILQLTRPVVSGRFITVDKSTFEHIHLFYKTPKASLSKMSINLYNYDGINFDFGGDGVIDIEYQIIYIFKIVTLDTDRKSINQRNLY